MRCDSYGDQKTGITQRRGVRRGTLLTILLLITVAYAQTPAIHLRGDRFKPLEYASMTAEQKTLVDHLLAGERHTTDGPFNVLLRSPELGDLEQKLGAQIRFHSSLAPRLNEFAILLTARHWNAQYEWYAHRRLALAAGVSPAIADSIAEGKRPASMQPDEEAVYNFATELFKTKQVSDAAFNAAVSKLTERGVVDLMGVIGYYHFVSMVLNVDRYPLPEGVQPPLKALPNGAF
jgi:4-carboxymuconolactone decarboxylase